MRYAILYAHSPQEIEQELNDLAADENWRLLGPVQCQMLHLGNLEGVVWYATMQEDS